ncbi:helix-turn-helix domain-containing protein, partial [Schinkia azotoformans]
MEKLILFLEINQLREKGFSRSAIARKLGISRTTV